MVSFASIVCTSTQRKSERKSRCLAVVLEKATVVKFKLGVVVVLGLVGVGVLLGLLCGGIRDAWRHR